MPGGAYSCHVPEGVSSGLEVLNFVFPYHLIGGIREGLARGPGSFTPFFQPGPFFSNAMMRLVTVSQGAGFIDYRFAITARPALFVLVL